MIIKSRSDHFEEYVTRVWYERDAAVGSGLYSALLYVQGLDNGGAPHLRKCPLAHYPDFDLVELSED